MNQSIYIMVTVPYVALMVVGFLIYRGCKKNADHIRSLQEAANVPSSDMPIPMISAQP